MSLTCVYVMSLTCVYVMSLTCVYVILEQTHATPQVSRNMARHMCLCLTCVCVSGIAQHGEHPRAAGASHPDAGACAGVGRSLLICSGPLLTDNRSLLTDDRLF
jgi:hypothetical protein